MSVTGLDVFDKNDLRPIISEDAARAIFPVLEAHVLQDEIEDVKGMLPAQLRRLWPEQA
jgi:uncharacterized protein (DUF2267 family)